MKNQKGFTLIELLVVIAIIGILSSVVLASLNTARAKGADAAIKSNLAGIRPQAEIYYDNNSDYGADVSSGDCTTAESLFVVDTTIAKAIAAAESASANSTATCYADDGVAGDTTSATSWAISVPLRTDSTSSWCVDSSGISASGTAVATGNVASCN